MKEEINLASLIHILIKREWFILGIFILAILAAFVFNVLSTKIYKIDASLEIALIQGQLIEEPAQLVAKINNGVYNGQYPFKISASNPLKTNLVLIEIQNQDIQAAKQALKTINETILKEHRQKTENKKVLLQNDIEKLQSKINLIDQVIEKTQNKIIPTENDISRVRAKITHAQIEQQNLENKVASLEKVLIYDQTPGTQFALFDTKEKLAAKKQEIEDLYLQINSLHLTIEDLKITVDNLEADKDDLKLNINALKKDLQEIHLTSIVKEPTASKKPIKPRLLRNIVSAGVLGLFMGIFLAFFIDWWRIAIKQNPPVKQG